MQRLGHPVSLTQCQMKVVEMTQFRATPFRGGIPGYSWVKWFKRHHPELRLCVAQGLDQARIKGLCIESVQSFYSNLERLYTVYQYTPSRVWNCDESEAQAGRNGGGVVLAKVGSRTVHSMTPNEWKWLSECV
jgi:hypothetical protein